MSLEETTNDVIYEKARTIFAEKKIETLPVLKEGIPTRLVGRFQAFFRDAVDKGDLPYSYYAKGLMSAGQNAKTHGYNRISAIEFGVAGGRGLIHLGIYAREVQKLYGIQIDVYGFDTGEGMLEPSGYADAPQAWKAGDYKMDIERLKAELDTEVLVLGDVCETTKQFLDEYNPAPIGFISVDVDQYTPTVAILDMLLQDHKFFLPTMRIYFDDLRDYLEFQGEALAIKEFNSRSEHIKITPEDINKSLKYCNRFQHPKFATARTVNVHLNI
jgi:hypothetical protein